MQVSGQLLASAILSRSRSPLYPLGRRLGGPQGWSGHGSKKKKVLSLPLLGINFQ